MDKSQLLETITEMTAQDKITLKEVLKAYHDGKPKSEPEPMPINQLFASLFYYLGALIIYAGISVLIWQHWAHLNFSVRILITLGVSVAAYLTALFLHLDKRVKNIADVFFLIAFLSYPFGLHTLFDHFGYNVNSLGFTSFTALTAFVFSSISFLVYRKTIFTVFNIFFGTLFVYAYTNYLIQGNPYFIDINFYSYRNLLLGIVYLLLGYHFTITHRKIFPAVLYSIGCAVFLCSVLDLSGWQPHQNLAWEIVMPIFCFIFIFLSIPAKSRALLIVPTIFLMVFIGKITSEYFVGSFGWPLSLVLAGFLIIASGFASLKFHHHFHTEKEMTT